MKRRKEFISIKLQAVEFSIRFRYDVKTGIIKKISKKPFDVKIFKTTRLVKEKTK